MIKKINSKLFFTLMGLSLFGTACVIPYVITLQADILKEINQPLALIFVAQFIQSLILFSVSIFFGLILSEKIGFKLPLFEAILEKRDYKKIVKNILGNSILIGITVAIIIYILDIFFASKGTIISTHEIYAPAWQTLLAAFYGGIVEEILMRLFLMTFFIWISMKLFRQKQAKKINTIISIIITAVIFGLGHLPITASITDINILIIGRAIVLNGIAGVVFGWLFWKKGLESAMIAHFTADIFLLTILPLLAK